MVEALDALALSLANQDGYVGEDYARSYRREAAEVIQSLKAKGFRIEPVPAEVVDG